MLDPAPQEKRPSRPRGDGQGRAAGPKRDSRPPRPAGNRERDWNHTPRESGSKDFEDMLSRFMARSDEKISDLKRNTDGKRGSFGAAAAAESSRDKGTSKSAWRFCRALFSVKFAPLGQVKLAFGQ